MSTTKPMETETITVTPNARKYLEALESYGLFEGDGDQEQLAPNVREVLLALHHVLGGGTVSIDIQSDGTSAIRNELDSAMDDAQNTCGGAALRDAGVHCM